MDPEPRLPERQRCWRARSAALAGATVGLGLLLAGCVESGSRTAPPALAPDTTRAIGREVAITRHLRDGEEAALPLPALVEHGRRLFVANWTVQEGGGRPFTKGTGDAIADRSQPLVFPRNFNRVSAMDANSCAGCHNAPHGIAGGGGDFVTSVFVLAQRFDFATFDPAEPQPTRSATDERGQPVSLQTVGNSRATLGMFGSGFIEMLARQMTADLRTIRDATPAGESRPLLTKGVHFGTIARNPDGSWDVSGVRGLPWPSLRTRGPSDPPNLIIRPFHQAGRVVSLREFTVTSFNHHHGIQAVERFGDGEDPDGDGVVDELTRADVTAVVVFQATLPVPGRVVPDHPAVERAVLLGEARFGRIGCAACHVPALPLDRRDWIFTEPNPHNPAGTSRAGEIRPFTVDLTDPSLPPPRLEPTADGVVPVPAYTDLRLHDVTCGPLDPNREPLDMQHIAGSPAFFAGNARFVTRKLWGAANEPPYFHHGQFTTLREAVLAHCGEALGSREAFQALSPAEQDAVIEFLKTLQVLPPGTRHLVVNERGEPKAWPPATLR